MNPNLRCDPKASLTASQGGAPSTVYPNMQTLRVLNTALDEPSAAEVRDMLATGRLDADAFHVCFQSSWCYWLCGHLAITPGGRALLGGGEAI